MRLLKNGTVLAIALAAASCGQGNSGNVMSSSNGNAFTEEQVDLALGNEVNASAEANTVGKAGNGAETDGSE